MNYVMWNIEKIVKVIALESKITKLTFYFNSKQPIWSGQRKNKPF